MFCVECGKEGKLYRGLCGECFLAKNVFISFPDQIDVEICSQCGFRKKKKGWILTEDQNLMEEIVMECAISNNDVTDFDVHITPKSENETSIILGVITHANVLGLKAPEEHETKIRFKKSICEECSKQQGGYWEVKVQFRGSERGLTEEDLEKALEIVDFMVGEKEKKDRGAFITKIEKMHSGLDFFLGSKNLGKAISKKLVSEFGGELKGSHKLVGRKDGKDVHRTTYSVRIPNYRIGDFVLFQGKVFMVLKVSTEKAFLRTLDTGENIFFSHKELKESKIVGGSEIVYDMVVVSQSEKEIQVLDPENLKTIDLIKPKYFNVKGESVKVIKSEAGYFLVGKD
jgi:nonsense-mediated mRNA decay protein 3